MKLLPPTDFAVCLGCSLRPGLPSGWPRDLRANWVERMTPSGMTAAQGVWEPGPEGDAY